MFHNFDCESADEVWCKIVRKFNCPEAPWQNVDGREGSTRELLHATISIRDPIQRWIQNRPKAINIALALAEIIWIMNGRQDSAFLKPFFPNITEFSGDTECFHGAYGERLRNHFSIGDQLQRAYEVLKATPNNRQVVLSIWDPNRDFPHPDGSPQSEDIPCNVSSMLKVRNGKLEWLQVMRSNDVFRGLPNNIVQFTTLQEIVAGWLGLPLGSYNHVSDSLHVYHDCVDEVRELEDNSSVVLNTDRLQLSYYESERTFQRMAGIIEEMIFTDMSTSVLKQHGLAADLPPAYLNILHVLCAELLRRRKELDLSLGRMGHCSNSVFNKMWYRWMLREHPKSMEAGNPPV